MAFSFFSYQKPWLRMLALLLVMLAGMLTILGSGSGNDNEDRPFAIDEAYVILENSPQEIDLSIIGLQRFGSVVNDLGTTPTDVAITTAAMHGTVMLDNTLATYTPDMDFTGIDSFGYTFTDSNDNSESGTITLLVSQQVPSPQQVLVDAANSRVLVTDDMLKAVVAMDLDTGQASYLSIASDGQANPFLVPAGLALDTANNRILVADIGLRAIVAVDPDTGARTILSDAMTPDGTNAFISPHRIAVDAANDRALVIDGGLSAVIAVDLTTGARAVLSSDTVPNTTNPLDAPNSIAIDVNNNRALVTDYGIAEVVAVNLDTGARTLLTDSGLSLPAGIDVGFGLAYVVDAGLEYLVSVGLDGGFIDVLSAFGLPDADFPFEFPEAVSVDVANERALVIDTALGALLEVNLFDDGNSLNAPDVGERRPFPDAVPAFGENLFNSPLGLATDAAANRLLVVDVGRGAVLAVDGQTGARTILSDPETPDDTNILFDPVSIELVAANRALVTDGLLAAVIDVDLTTGARTILSNGDTPDEVNAFVSPYDVVLDTVVPGRALVTDRSARALFAVDLASGARTVVFNDDTDPDLDLLQPQRLIIDAANSRALVIDAGRPGIVAIDLLGTNHEILSDASVPANQDVFLSAPTGLVLDAANNRLLVSDASLRAVIAVDLTDGGRTVYSSLLEGNGAVLQSPWDISEGLDGNSVLLIDRSLPAVITLDLDNASRATLSR